MQSGLLEFMYRELQRAFGFVCLDSGDVTSILVAQSIFDLLLSSRLFLDTRRSQGNDLHTREILLQRQIKYRLSETKAVLLQSTGNYIQSLG